jgi:BirA family biotin operon repressor/biotin-[acetyl-CoA-carboxylase] ligase
VLIQTIIKVNQSIAVLCSYYLSCRFLSMNGLRIHLSAVESTNSYTIDQIGHSDMLDWTVVVAEEQTAGRGQRGKRWMSVKGLNLTFSVFVRMKLRVSEQFSLAMKVSAALVETLNAWGLEARVKWPNDILVDGKKVAGILIENQVEGDWITSSVIGIGLNVNQCEFEVCAWPPVSMAMSLGQKCDREQVLDDVLANLFVALRDTSKSSEDWLKWYESRLYACNEVVTFAQAKHIYTGRILGVKPSGALRLKQEDGSEVAFFSGEISLRQIDA